ncbi:MAG: COR domain-containing protein, partial [Phormidesmis sp.]
EIPAVIGQLTNLTHLSLYNNQLTEIPAVIGQLTNLTKLDLEQNKIAEIPVWLESLLKLTKLDLRNNPLPISPEILGPSDVSEDPGSPEHIFQYLREMRSGEKRQLNEAKLLLIGQGSVGKTSLINRLVDNHYNPNESQTDGLNVSKWPLEVNGQEIRLNVWDFGGQEIYHATHQFFLTKRSLYILTCNCRTSEDENRIEYWLKLIQSFGGESPVIIVGNKADEQPLDINRKALRDKYPNIKAILETSCQSGHGIDDLRAKITYEVSQLDDVYNLLPLTWFEVKEQLEAMDQDFISYPQYTGLCYQQNVTEEQSQEQLIDLLHNLGLVLNFRDHPILKDTNVLNPNWVTTGIYAILSDEALKTQNKGILTCADLTRILDAERYPIKRHPYLTKLIQEFQLGFPLITPLADTQPQKFLLPSLLPKDEPEDTNLEGDTLEFQYHYRILPESILSRFIVLTHEDIYEHTYWRSGVMLHYQEGSETYNIARVKADPEDKKIFIAISGKASTRRTFLAMLRKTFSKIHSSFANPEVTEWVPVPNHPDHPPLDYQELLGLERMGDRELSIGKLGIRVNIRKLLDGYETPEARVQKHRNEMGKEGDHYHFYGDKPHFNQQRGDNSNMSETTNNLQGANIGNFANEVKDNARQQANQHNHPAVQQNLAEAVRDLKALFAELDKTYDKNTPDRQDLIEAKAIKAINTDPTFKKRVVKALKEGSISAIAEAIKHPAVKPVLAAIEGFMNP